MAEQVRRWRRQHEDFWRAHHEGWQRSDLNQRAYCEAQGIPLKAFGNWRAIFKAEPGRKLLYRRQISPPLSPSVSPPISPRTYPSSRPEGPIVPRPREGHRRRFSEADKVAILAEAARSDTGVADVAHRYGIDRRVLRRWKQELGKSAAPVFVMVQITDAAAISRAEGSVP